MKTLEGGRAPRRDSRPKPEQTAEEYVEELIRQGKAHREGDGTIPDWFFT